MSSKLSERQLKHVQKPYIATLATVRARRRAAHRTVWYRYIEGVFFILTERSSKKARNIAHDPRIELCIDDRERPPYHTVIIRGRATIEPYPGDDWRLALAVHYLGEENGRRYVETTPTSPDEVAHPHRAGADCRLVALRNASSGDWPRKIEMPRVTLRRRRLQPPPNVCGARAFARRCRVFSGSSTGTRSISRSNSYDTPASMRCQRVARVKPIERFA